MRKQDRVQPVPLLASAGSTFYRPAKVAGILIDRDCKAKATAWKVRYHALQAFSSKSTAWP